MEAGHFEAKRKKSEKKKECLNQQMTSEVNSYIFGSFLLLHY